MKLWIDDIRPAPEGYVWCKSVNEAKSKILENANTIAELGEQVRNLDAKGFYDEADRLHMAAANTMLDAIDLDHDAGDYVYDGGDYIKLLDWLEEVKPLFWLDIVKFHIHSMNPVGVENMRRIIQRNGWKEVEMQEMTREQIIAYMCDNRGVKVKHESFADDEYIYMEPYQGDIYDENGYLFEDWYGSHDGMRIRQGGLWEQGWKVV